MIYQIFGVLVVLFGLSVIVFNNFWQNHLYNVNTMNKLRDQGPLSKKVITIIFGIVMIVLGIISILKGIVF